MFDAERFINEKVEELRQIIDAKAIAAVSGGVDSTTAAALLYRAVGDTATALFIDTGLLRKGEKNSVESLLKEMGIPYRVIDASAQFFERLKGITTPEKKRKIIGKTFIDVFESVADEIDAEYLIQGTIAPDWIESGGGIRDTIKSHHNVGGLPDRVRLKIVEPLRDLYKDEVRKVAKVLGVKVHEKQPFPGPGLAIRVIGEVTREKIEIIREICAIIEEEIEESATEGMMELPWQYFGVLLPVKSVGVMGDVRVYRYTVVVRAVQSVDGMTAAYSKIPHEVLEKISHRISNSMKDYVNRVVYDITNKPPGTIEWE